VLKVSNLKGISLIQLFKYIKLIHNLGFVGSTVSGATMCDGSNIPTFPRHLIEPFFSLSKTVFVVNFENVLHLFEFLINLFQDESQIKSWEKEITFDTDLLLAQVRQATYVDFKNNSI
jgi:hypothetical protein